MTGIARVIYILESDNKIYKDQIPKFLNKIITLLKFIYFTTIISFLSYLIFIIVSTKKFKINNMKFYINEKRFNQYYCTNT